MWIRCKIPRKFGNVRQALILWRIHARCQGMNNFAANSREAAVVDKSISLRGWRGMQFDHRRNGIRCEAHASICWSPVRCKRRTPVRSVHTLSERNWSEGMTYLFLQDYPYRHEDLFYVWCYWVPYRERRGFSRISSFTHKTNLFFSIQVGISSVSLFPLVIRLTHEWSVTRRALGRTKIVRQPVLVIS